MTKRKTVIEVLSDFTKKWGDLYDYSKIKEYTYNKEKLPIVCKKHGLFYMSANDHLRGHGCPKCADEKTGERCRMTVEEFLLRAKEVHKEYYDYSIVSKENFRNSNTKIPIICKTHGVFMQKPNEHLIGRGCYKCGKKSMAAKQSLTRDEVVERCNSIFNNKYDYSLFKEYRSVKDTISVICPKHGEWNVSVKNHLYRESGCPKCKRSCGEEKIAGLLKKRNIDFIEQFRINNESLFCENIIIVADFYLPSLKTIIEYNGIQHYKDINTFFTRSLCQQQDRDAALRLYCYEHNLNLIEIPYTEYDNIDSILNNELKMKNKRKCTMQAARQ